MSLLSYQQSSVEDVAISESVANQLKLDEVKPGKNVEIQTLKANVEDSHREASVHKTGLGEVIHGLLEQLQHLKRQFLESFIILPSGLTSDTYESSIASKPPVEIERLEMLELAKAHKLYTTQKDSIKMMSEKIENLIRVGKT